MNRPPIQKRKPPQPGKQFAVPGDRLGGVSHSTGEGAAFAPPKVTRRKPPARKATPTT